LNLIRLDTARIRKFRAIHSFSDYSDREHENRLSKVVPDADYAVKLTVKAFHYAARSSRTSIDVVCKSD